MLDNRSPALLPSSIQIVALGCGSALSLGFAWAWQLIGLISPHIWFARIDCKEILTNAACHFCG
jgi:hypothetical protein